MSAQWNQVWEKIPPKYRQILVYASAFGCLIVVSYLFVTGGGSKKQANEDKKVVRDVFTPNRLNERYGLPGLAHDLEQANQKIDQLTKKIENLLENKEGRREQDSAKMLAQVKEMEKQLQEIKKEKEDLKNHETKASPAGASAPVKSLQTSGPTPKGPPGKPEKDKTPEPPKKEMARTLAPGSPLTSRTAKEIRVITAESSAREAAGPEGQPGRIEPGRAGRKYKAPQEKGTFIPAGSIFSGTLITGMDAPCGQAARRDPFPVLLRVKLEAILPNRFTADVRECFLVASGYGDISSERAYFRSERLSCIRQDGKALENRVEMYATGEDGKAGVRGRLVSKQGAIISRALLAGFMQGFSQIFGKSPVMTLNIPQNGLQQATPFQRNLSKDSMEAAGIAGVGNALDNLSKYYLDMAKDMFPVVEIDAGRRVDFIMISGVSLKLQGG